MSETHWAIMPFIDCVDLTEQATLDLLAQSLPTRVLLIDQGSSRATSDHMREFVEAHHPRVLLWTWNPPMPSLSGVWNRALRYVWALGGTEALVVNNDVRLRPDTYELLDSILCPPVLFVSAMSVRADQFRPEEELEIDDRREKGGPDFSCFLLSREGHERYPFDEQFIPAYRDDLDMHRRYMLGGDGDKIFSVNLPFLHYRSSTINAYTPEQRAVFNKQYAAAGEYYRRKWGGDVNEETLRTPFGTGTYSAWLTAALLTPGLDNELITTPDLQRHWQITPRDADAP